MKVVTQDNTSLTLVDLASIFLASLVILPASLLFLGILATSFFPVLGAIYDVWLWLAVLLHTIGIPSSIANWVSGIYVGAAVLLPAYSFNHFYRQAKADRAHIVSESNWISTIDFYDGTGLDTVRQSLALSTQNPDVWGSSLDTHQAGSKSKKCSKEALVAQNGKPQILLILIARIMGTGLRFKATLLILLVTLFYFTFI